MRAHRLVDQPIVSPDTPGWDPQLVGENINGPSLIAVPGWIDRPLGRYYLYFAHHQGDRVRLAFADDLRGPWTIHTPGTLRRDQTPFTDHIASPDLHVDDAGQRLVMYFHGHDGVTPDKGAEQPSAVATSRDGLTWSFDRLLLNVESYARVFDWAGRRYAISKRGKLYEDAGDGAFHRIGGFELDHDGRHWAVLADDNEALRVIHSRFGDAPERLVHARIDTSGEPLAWRMGPPETLLRPERAWEGAGLPVEASRPGASHEPVHQLRDPAVFRDRDGRRYVVYSVAGERGLGLAELTLEP